MTQTQARVIFTLKNVQKNGTAAYHAYINIIDSVDNEYSYFGSLVYSEIS